MKLYEILSVIGLTILLFLGTTAVEKCFTGKKDANKYLAITFAYGFLLVVIILISVVI